MTQLPRPVALHDVDDIEAFVNATINRARLILTTEEREELVATGLEITYQLASRYDPQRDGYTQAGRFSGYLAMFLPRKLGDAWHRQNPTHTLRNQPDGKRRWEYGDKPISLDQITTDNPDHPHLQITAPAAPVNLETRIHTALTTRAQVRIRTTTQIGVLLSEGATVKDIAEQLGLLTSQVREHMADLEPIAHHFESRAA